MAQLSGSRSRNDLTDRLPVLRDWLADKLDSGGEVKIEGIRGGPSGLSNATYFLQVSSGDATSELVLRMAPESFTLIPEGELTVQFEVPKVLAAHGIPVAPMRWFEPDPAVLGAPFLVMDRVQGEVCPDRFPGYHGKGVFADLDESGRRDLWYRTIDAMAAVHRLGTGVADSLSVLGKPGSGAESLDAELAKIERWMDFGGAHENAPHLEPALAWLQASRPSAGDWGLCWGDAKIGNVLYRDGSVAALLDWELAHFGPPELDLAYFVIVDQVAVDTHGLPRLAGLPDEVATVSYYERALGRSVVDFDYYRTFSALRLAALLLLANRVSAQMGWNFFPPGFLESNPTTRILLDQLDRMR